MNSHASKDEYIKQYYEKSKIMDAFAEGKNKNLS